MGIDFGLTGRGRTVDEGRTFTLEGKTERSQIWFPPEILRLQMHLVKCQSNKKSDISVNKHKQDLYGSNQDYNLSQPCQSDDKGDIFALALVFGCLLLKGTHLYGSNENEDEIRDNIINKSPINMQKIDEKLREFYEDELFEKMLEDEPSKRISAAQVVSQLKSIKDKLSRKEGELLKVCAEHTEPDLAEKIKDLIRYGIDVNAKDEQGWNALHHLCRHNSNSNLINAIRHLTESGIDVKAKGNDGSNALHYLVRHNPILHVDDIMEFLAESGIDLFAKDNDGRSPFFYSKDSKNDTKMKISYNRDAFLGKGGYGHVFEGTYGGCKVAVKRVLLDKVNKREEEAMLKLDHQNIIKLVHYESDNDFRYYALELCVASLDKVFLKEDDAKKYKGPMPRHIEGFLQLALGLEHIDSKNLIHRDIKPENILISKTPTSQSISTTLKWADFGLSRHVNERGTFTMKEIKGTKNWFAPEILELLRVDKEGRGTIKSDVFAQNLVFGCLFLDGKHLYGSETNEIQENITKNNPINMENIDGIIREFYEDNLLKKMLADIPNRMTSTDVVIELKSIKDKLVEKEEEFRQLFASDLSSTLKEKFIQFIRIGIDLNAKNNSSSTLIEAIAFLVENRIEVNANDNDGRNALHYLCANSLNPKLTDAIEKLKQCGIDVNAKETDGWNALHFLCSNSSNPKLTDAIEKLKQSGIDFNAKETDGWNALHLLCILLIFMCLLTNLLKFETFL